MGLSAGAHVTDNIRLVRLLGKGGMGSVWVAQHLTLDLEVAVKFIAAELLQGGDPIVLTRFRREARLAAKLDSQHVVRTLDHGVTDDGTPYIVMELLRGESLAERLDRDRRIRLRDAARIVTEVAEGLSVAHAAGIVHRDIKPHNVFLARGAGKNEMAKVLDFGVAKATTDDAQPLATSSGVLIGTPQYMSPEQLMRAGPVAESADLWALSVTAYEMIVGKLPFRGATLAATLVAITRADLEPPSSVDTTLPGALDTWFKRALAIDPDRRFSTAEELSAAFRAAVEGVPTGEIVRPNLARKEDADTRVDAGSATAEFVAARSLDVPLSEREPALAPTLPVSVSTLGPTREVVSQAIPLVVPARRDKAEEGPDAKTARSNDDGEPDAQAPRRSADQADAAPSADSGTQTALVASENKSGDGADSRLSASPGEPRSKAARARWVWGIAAVAGVGMVTFFLVNARPPPRPSEPPPSSPTPTAASTAALTSAAAESAPVPTSSAKVATLGTIPKTSVGAGYAPASRVWLPEFAIAREVGDESATFLEAQGACERRAMSLCSDAQWARACEAHPEIAERASWTLTAADSGVVVRGGPSGGSGSEGYGFGGTSACTHRAVTDPSTADAQRIGLCCSRAVGVASNVDNAAFLKVTASRLGEYETAYDSGNGDRIVALMEDPTEFHGKKLAKDDLEAAAVWMSKQGRLFHDVCEVSLEKKDGETTWTADCTVVIDGAAGLFRGVRRYVSGGDHGLIQAVREPKSPIRLGPAPPEKPHK